MKGKIDPLAIVEDGAIIGENVVIEPFAVVKKNAILQDGVVIKSHAYIDGYTTIGKNTVIWPGASIGTKSQDLKYQGEKTFVSIGKNCDIREFVTINSSCGENTSVEVGDNCLIMTQCHIAHNCKVGNGVIMANGAMIAGHVELEDYVIIGGMTPVHQFCKIGKHAMVGGMSRVSNDIPPYTIGGGDPYKFGGINSVGLKRHNFSFEQRKLIMEAYRITYKTQLTLSQAILKIESELKQTNEIKHWIDFCKTSKRGLLGFESKDKKILTALKK